jgi:microcompartment protein CcmK/EutM
MQLARVTGTVVSTLKDANLQSHKLLMVQPISPDREDFGRPVVALDAIGAGVGEFVFFVRGREAAFPFYPGEPPTDACVVGIVDSWDIPAVKTEAGAGAQGL